MVYHFISNKLHASFAQRLLATTYHKLVRTAPGLITRSEREDVPDGRHDQAPAQDRSEDKKDNTKNGNKDDKDEDDDENDQKVG